ncbi:hypothetical protein Q9R20_05450 [Microbacterium sp. PRF11]|uniref:DUF7927 domain-containing protein n=1 Tax=Microbacterium sp. PRF11 TaxID=2962593 RepID=UPI002881DC1A|nr:hypothetical protein [Microbacterium sp. PRF11]MDT0116432.1 hypothetical protein [Microbacterium sp. PRF11]
MLSSLLAFGLVAATLSAGLVTASSPALAAPGNPGSPSDPNVLYNETFENGMGTDPVLLTNYTGARGTQYTADQAWLENCNGAIVEWDSPDSAIDGSAINRCRPNTSGQNPEYSYGQLRQFAYALGEYTGTNPNTNHVVAAYTAGDPGANRTEIQTVNTIPLNASGRYVSFSVDTAAVNCGVSAPAYNFYLVQSDGTQVFAGSANACTSGKTVAVPAKGAASAQSAVSVGTYTSDGAVRVTGDSVGLIMRNSNGSGNGNDAAFDNLKILDVTPQMDKSFSPALQRTGDVSTLTFTVTNTSELGAKSGWGFTDNLPDGLVLANGNVGGTCDAVTSAPAGGRTIRVADGNLSKGESSCTITVEVTSTQAGTYDNCPTTNVTTNGLNQPDCARIEFSDPTFTTSKTVDKEFARPGDVVTYTITVKNTGRVPYSEQRPASLTDDLSKVLDDATYNDDASNGAVVSGDTLSWSGALAVDETRTITYSVTVADPDKGDKVLDNVVTPKGDGGTCDPEGECKTSTPVQSYKVEKTSDKSTVSPGDKVTYTITVTNTGKVAYSEKEPASFTDDLSKVTDDATYNNDATNGATVSGNTLSWAGTLAIGETKTIVYSVTVNKPDTGDKVLENAVVLTGPGPTPPPPPIITKVGTYTVEKAVDKTTAKSGDKVTYTVTVKNTGQTDYTTDEPASFTDDLSKVTDDATYNRDATNGATVDGNTLSWSGALAKGETKTIVYSFTINTPDLGDRVLHNVVTPTGPGGDCGGVCETTTKNTTPPPGPLAATGGMILATAPAWPWIGLGALGLAVLIALGVARVRRVHLDDGSEG